MIRYSARAAKALGFLKKRYNDIEVFVEDTASPNMWVRLLERVLPDGVRLTSVNLLGGRDRVLEACRLDQADDGRRRLYIIDGDFDFLIGRRKERLKFLHRMPCYCVENLLSHRDAVVEAAFTCCTKTPHGEIERKLDGLFEGLEGLIRRLFVVYATCEKLKTGIKTVANGVYPFLTKVQGVTILDEAKLWRKITELTKQAIQLKGALIFSRERKKIAVREATLPLEKVVSGKDFIFPFIWTKLKEIKDFLIHLEHFKVHLARSYHPSRDPLLRRCIVQLAS